MGEIRVNYANARRQARRLRGAAEDCREIISHLKGVGGELPGCWTGDAANTYMLEIDERATDISKIQSDLSELAMIIQRVADEFEAAERRMKERIQESVQD